MYEEPLYRDRVHAGRVLAQRLRPFLQDDHPLILALPRGGVPVASQVAQEFHAGLDIFLVRKIGVPGHEELAMGAVASGGLRVLNHAIVRQLRIPPDVIERATEREQQEIVRRERLYRDGRPPLNPAGRTVVLVDDGLATGATMLAAARALRPQNPERLIVAVPVAAVQTCEEFEQHVDLIVCAATPEPFYAVGAWYADFSQTTDGEVRALLEQAAHQPIS